MKNAHVAPPANALPNAQCTHRPNALLSALGSAKSLSATKSVLPNVRHRSVRHVAVVTTSSSAAWCVDVRIAMSRARRLCAQQRLAHSARHSAISPSAAYSARVVDSHAKMFARRQNASGIAKHQTTARNPSAAWSASCRRIAWEKHLRRCLH